MVSGHRIGPTLKLKKLLVPVTKNLEQKKTKKRQTNKFFFKKLGFSALLLL